LLARSPLLRSAIIAATALAAIGSAAALRAGPEAQTPAPGAWDIATRIDHLDIPGLPPAMVAKIAADPANARPRAVCIPAAKPGSPPPVAVFHTLKGACAYESWQAAAGSLRAVLACAAPDGAPGEARVEISGSYTATTFAIVSETIARDGTGATQMHMRATLSGTLAPAGADCPGS
jgi:hypothetical protein